MKKISSRDTVMIVILAIIVIAACWYLFFYQPLQDEIASLNSQIQTVENNTTVAMGKANRMNAMQAELDEIFAQPADQITEIAPYDNATVVIAQLNGILAASEKYELSFRDADINSDGTVRRVISMNFACATYEDARSIISQLTNSHWRCIVNSVTMKSDSDIMLSNKTEALKTERYEALMEQLENKEITQEEMDKALEEEIIVPPVAVTAQITFFESTNIQG